VRRGSLLSRFQRSAEAVCELEFGKQKPRRFRSESAERRKRAVADLPEPKLVPLKNGWVIQLIGPSPLGGDIHETFRVDPSGDVTGGHTTARIPGGHSINLPWNR
jgi:hypothetical protein